MTDLTWYGLRWAWTWARDVLLFIFLLVMLLVCWLFGVDWP